MRPEIWNHLSNARDRNLVALGLLAPTVQQKFREAAKPVVAKVVPKGADVDRVLDELQADGQLGLLDGERVICAFEPSMDDRGKWSGAVVPRWRPLDENGVRAAFDAMVRVNAEQRRAQEAHRLEVEHDLREQHETVEDKRAKAYEEELTRDWRGMLTGDGFIARVALIAANIPSVDELSNRELLLAIAKTARHELARIASQSNETRMHEPMPGYARQGLGVEPFARKPYKSRFGSEQ
jgi:hypothetical protein